MNDRPLETLPVLIVDCQATGAAPDKGHVLEIGWLTTTAATAEATPRAHLIELPAGERIPRMVGRITGITDADMTEARPAPEVWRAVLDAATPLGEPTPAVAHFARFEDVFLRELHGRLEASPFPLELICTHEIARRLLPDLPRRGLRALAGYFGFSVGQLRRSAHHAEATAFVWHHLVAELAKSHGVSTLGDAKAWLQNTPTKSASRRAYPMSKAKRLAVPDEPGVYRMLRTNGDVLYVGKAISLKRRVNSYFRKQSKIPEHTLEMLSQARDLDVTTTETAVEAALLESEEIKRLVPPYNRALHDDSDGPWFFDRTFESMQSEPDRTHVMGPIRGRRSVAALPGLRVILAGGHLEPSARHRVVDHGPIAGPPDEPFAAGVQMFLGKHRPTAGPVATELRQAQIAAKLWRAQLDAGPDSGDDDAHEDWTAEDVCDALQDSLREAFHQLRRARWLARLASSTVAWRCGDRWRCLRVAKGVILERAWRIDPWRRAPPPMREATALVDLPTYDRMRILSTELRREVTDGRDAIVDLGGRRPLTGDALRRTLLWA